VLDLRMQCESRWSVIKGYHKGSVVVEEFINEWRSTVADGSVGQSASKRALNKGSHSPEHSDAQDTVSEPAAEARGVPEAWTKRAEDNRKILAMQLEVQRKYVLLGSGRESKVSRPVIHDPKSRG
jgi:hypothetical protein